MTKYTFFDVETANSANDTLCSIGLVETDGDKILSTYSFLVNPEADFDEKNIAIHNITPAMVEDKPTLAKIWPEISHLFTDHTIGGHNITFDISVLRKHLRKYGIKLQEFKYICTMKMAKSIPSIDSVKLVSLCEKFDITLKNHDSLSDAVASFELFKIISNMQQIEVSDFIVSSDDSSSNKSYNKVSGTFISEKRMHLQQFKAYAAGILADGHLEMLEIIKLREFVSNLIFEDVDNYYLHRIYDLLQQIYADGEVTKYEVEDLTILLNEFLNPVESNHSLVQCITFDGKLFCLSGNFDNGSKSDIEKLIEQRGGICKGSVTKKTDYLIVGGAGSDAWCMGNFGTKVEKALEMQDKGINIKIIREEDFFKVL